ncbi:NADH:ubiquinone oxidoreductase complex I intermediate-associated protein 30 [Hypoxylon trugodes]|uniref:NADH:ubiquinone oxidoreductase complex I intermediate-associated protein 30 n=1 Tax=Hypoxylon trugodes TaxID=326681 RepID=UPI00218EDFF2|nr:NADH:ubiquinone oxidoreductase complex I intermediate-associated protein 30 [Hypoxylon trugodes]KAI1388008.1 NADH:ubiquinone oxidoreductase complex I intermediate-associated protein 30 [Hypoxylon trugodes]
MPLGEPNFYLFGGLKPWIEQAWIASDDRVRGGKSQSYLICSPDSSTASFRGHLDISALGGAGFASQRTVDPQSWDLFDYQGIRLGVGEGDGKKYTIAIKDDNPPKREDGREESTVSWEYDFVPTGHEVTASWEDFKPMYRGQPKPDAEPLRLDHIKRISIMMRSFFGEQEGPFKLELKYIAAIQFNNHANE